MLTEIQKIPILFYHSIANKNSKANKLQVSYKDFKNQLKLLSILGFKSINPNLFNDPKYKITGKEIIISFDDGYKDNIKNAFPLLQEYSFKGLFLLVANQIGKENLWDISNNYPKMNLMNNNDIHKLIRNGHYIGSQGLDHLNLNSNLINKSDIKKEIKISKEILEKRFKVKINFFSYAFGQYNKKIIKIVKKYYNFGLTTERFKLKKKYINNFNLTRISINRNTNILRFLFKIFFFKFLLNFRIIFNSFIDF